MMTLPLLKEVVSPALVRGVGYALLHSLWQGGVLALLLAGALPLLRRRRAEVRYGVAASALASLLVVVGLTFSWYYQRPAPARAALAAAGPYAAPMAFGLLRPAARPVGARVVVTTLAKAPSPLAWLRASGSRLEPYLPLVVVAWLVGLLLMSGRLAGGLLYASRLRQAGTQALGTEWERRLAALAARAGLRRPVALLESARVAGPLVLGHLRPVILLPLGAVAGLSPALLEALLAHELAHIVRRDYLLNLGLAVAEVLFFYHPAVWFMASCLRAERENCCDDQAAALCGGDRLRVARALAALAELEAATAPAPRLALAAAGSGGRGSLLARVRRLALGSPQAPTMRERLLAGSLTLLGLLGLSTGVVLAARPERQVPQTPASPADTVRRVAAAPPVPADTVRRVERTVRVEVNNEAAPSQLHRLQQAAPRRDQPSTVIVEKDKKGRLVSMSVNGQPVETDQPGKKSRHGKPTTTVEFVQPPRRREAAGPGSFSFDFSLADTGEEALRTARQGLAESLHNPDLTDEQRRAIEQAQRSLGTTKGFHGAPRTFSYHLDGPADGSQTQRLQLKRVAKSAGSHYSFDWPAGEEGRDALRDQQRAERDGLRDQERALALAQRDMARADRAMRQTQREAQQSLADTQIKFDLQFDGPGPDRTAARRAQLEARIAAAEAELRTLDGEPGELGRSGRRGLPVPRPPRAPRAPLGPAQGVPVPPASPAALPAPPLPPVPPSTTELRNELRRDGLIGPHEQSFTFEMGSRGALVNGRALTPAQTAKYRGFLGKPAGKGKSEYKVEINEK